MRKILFLFFSFQVVFAFSQNVTIKGTAKDDIGSLVRIIGYDDLFSNLEKTIAQTNVDDRGDFHLQLEIETTSFAYLAVNLEKGEFYITPDADYTFSLINDTSDNKGSIFDRLPLSFTLDSKDGGIQRRIEDFNIVYNEFIYNNVRSIYNSTDKSLVKDFISKIETEFENEDSEYVANYVRYSLASLKWLSKIESNQGVLENYFVNHPVLYSNIQYCDFFKEFFKSYFGSEKLFRYEDMIPALNSSNGIMELDELISRDSLLNRDKRVSEIVSMLLMSRYYFDRYVDQDAIIHKLQYISENSQYFENRKIASNYILVLQDLQSGTPAPHFRLSDNAGDMFSLDDFKDKFLLLAFVENDCPMCQFHMKEMEEMRQKLNFDIVTLVAGNESVKLQQFANERNYTWPILNLGNEILLLEDYNVKVFPTYIFINPDGTVAYVHLPMPTENMELYLTRFIEKYKKTTEGK
jgi:peroxiredoxin